MSDDSETVEDTKESSLAAVTDDSCALEFIEIGGENDNRDSHYYMYVKEEPADEHESESLGISTQVSTLRN